LSQKSLQSTTRTLKGLLESGSIVGSYLPMDYFRNKQRAEKHEIKQQQHQTNFLAELLRGDSFLPDNFQESQIQAKTMTEENIISYGNQVAEAKRLRQEEKDREKEFQKKLKDTSILHRRGEDGKYIINIKEKVPEPEPEPKKPIIKKKILKETDEEGYVKPVVGIFEKDHEKKTEYLKKKIVVDTRNNTVVSFVETFSKDGKVVSKKTTAVKSQVQTQSKETSDEITQSLIKANPFLATLNESEVPTKRAELIEKREKAQQKALEKKEKKEEPAEVTTELAAPEQLLQVTSGQMEKESSRIKVKDIKEEKK